MNIYWPNMYCVKNSGEIIRHFTYNACKSLNEAKKAISFWNDNMPDNQRPIISWIDAHYDNGGKKIVSKKEYHAHIPCPE